MYPPLKDFPLLNKEKGDSIASALIKQNNFSPLSYMNSTVIQKYVQDQIALQEEELLLLDKELQDIQNRKVDHLQILAMLKDQLTQISIREVISLTETKKHLKDQIIEILEPLSEGIMIRSIVDALKIKHGEDAASTKVVEKVIDQMLREKRVFQTNPNFNRNRKYALSFCTLTKN